MLNFVDIPLPANECRLILKLAEALAFLHNDARILHRNVTPEAVIINRCGDWKLGGFDFCVTATNAPGQLVGIGD